MGGECNLTDSRVGLTRHDRTRDSGDRAMSSNGERRGAGRQHAQRRGYRVVTMNRRGRSASDECTRCRADRMVAPLIAIAAVPVQTTPELTVIVAC